MDTMRRLAAALLLAACAPGATCGPAVRTSPTSPAITPSATATTSATLTTAPTATASTAVPSPTAGGPSRYGYVTASEGRIVVRGERPSDPSLSIVGDAPAASHDGTRIAFWRTAAQGSRAPELRIVEVPSGSERVVTTAPSGWSGGAIAWSDDDSGLLYEVDRVRDPNAPPGPPVAPPSRMFSVDLSAASAQPVTDPALDFDRGLVFIPLAWDRSEGVAAALTTGEGGYAVEWVVWDQKAGSVRKTRFPWQVIYSDVSVSANASLVLANDRGANALRFWPLADIGNVQTLAPRPDATVRSRGASWRPGSQGDLAWVAGSSASLHTFATDRVPTVLYRGQSDLTIVGWRADGSGLLLREGGGSVFAVDLTTLRRTELSHLGAAIVGGVLLR